MSKIKIFLTEVDAAAPKINNQNNKIGQAVTVFVSVKRSLDPKVLARKNISGQFMTIQQDIQEVENGFKKIKTFITTAVDKYEAAEKRIQRAADKGGKPKEKGLFIEKFKLRPGKIMCNPMRLEENFSSSAIAAKGAGAAVGSLFLPPVGTIVGAGTLVGIGLNSKIGLLNDKSIVDVAKEGAYKGAKSVIKGAKKVGVAFKSLNAAFW